MSSKHTEETDVPEHLSLSLGGLSCLSAAELCGYLLSCPACLITYCKRPVCVSEIQCLCAQQPDIFVSLVDLGETMSLLCFPRQPSCSLCLVLPLLLLVFRLFIYFSVILFCFITFPFNPSYSFCVYFFLSQFFSLFMSPSLLSVLFFPPQLFFSLSSRHKSLSCWLLKCEEWQI